MKTMQERFNARVRITPACWIWTGNKNAKGYGFIRVDGHQHYAHRLSFDLYCGELDPDLMVCHRCDNPGCVNPAHLFQGTNADNMGDMVRKGRSLRGELHGRSKLTAQQVEAIRADSRSLRAIAKDFGICHRHVGDLKKGKSWSHPTITRARS